MKNNSKNMDFLVKKALKEIEKKSPTFAEKLMKKMQKISAMTTIKPEDGLKKFNI